MKKILAFILALAMLMTLTACGASSSSDKGWPSGTVTYYAAVASGTPGESSARIVCDWLQEKTGTGFMLTLEPSGGGIVAAQKTLSAAPDGRTMMSGAAPMILAHIKGTTEIDVLDKEQCILIPGGTKATREYGSLIVARADSPYNTWQEFVDYCKAHPGEVRWGTQNTNGAEMKVLALIDHYGLDVNLLYGATGELLTALLGDNMNVSLMSPATALQYFETGDLKPLIMDLTEEYKGSDPVLAEIETYVDYGIEDLMISTPTVFALPAGTDPALVEEIISVFGSMSEDSELAAALKPFNMAPVAMTQEEVYAEAEAYRDKVAALYEKYFT